MKRMIIVPSKSRYEIELERHGSEETARDWFGGSEVWSHILSSHEAQKANLALLKQRLGNYRFVDRAALDDALIHQHDLFAFVGGDNHFTYCAQLVLQYLQSHPSERKDVVGVVLDPTKSLGALLEYSVPEFIDAVPRLVSGEYAVQEWTTLNATVQVGDGMTSVTPAVCDYFIGEWARSEMSRNQSYIDGRKVLAEKGSGILVATGAGAGNNSWYDTNHCLMFGESDVLSRETRAAHAIVTESKRAVIEGGESARVELRPGQVLTVYSYNDARGVLLPDSHENHGARFMIGAKAEIRVSDICLRVVER